MADEKTEPEMGEEKPTKPESPRTGPTDDLESKDPEEVKAEARRLREALKKTKEDNLRNQRRKEELEEEKRQREEATLSETEKQKKEREREREESRQARTEAAEAKAELVKLRMDREIERIAIAADFEYPDTVPQLVDRSRVEWDAEAGKVLGAKEAVERLAKERPKLLKARSGGGTPPRDGPRRAVGEGGGRDLSNPAHELAQTGRVGGRM